MQQVQQEDGDVLTFLAGRMDMSHLPPGTLFNNPLFLNSSITPLVFKNMFPLRCYLPYLAIYDCPDYDDRLDKAIIRFMKEVRVRACVCIGCPSHNSHAYTVHTGDGAALDGQQAQPN